MTKQEFLNELKAALRGLPREDVEERLVFYSEMIDDRIEEGLSEAVAVDEMGPVSHVASQIVAEIPFTKLVKERMTPKHRLSGGEITLLVLGAPLWISLLLAAFAVVLSVYVSVWSVVVSLWAVFASLVASAFGGILGGLSVISFGSKAAGAVLVAAALCAGGLSVFCFFACRAATNGMAVLSAKLALAIKNCL